MSDDTGRRKAVEGLLIEAHEQERTRIARHLHDDIGQRMAGLTMDLDALCQSLPLSTEAQKRIRDVSDRTLALAKDIQALSQQLHPSTLDYVGLVSAAKAFCKDISKRENVAITFTHEEVPNRIAADVALSLFRVVEEAVTNVVKHGGVRDATVRLIGKPSEIQLEIVDNGGGFDPEAVLRNGAPGLVGMRERMRLVGGELVIESQRGTGTVIRARVPL